VGPRQRKFAVIEVCGKPAGGSVAEATFLSECTLMLVVLGMAGITIGRCVLENEIRVTAFTRDIGMLSDQREGGKTMVKG